MAKRLNKKVTIIGSIVLALMLVAAILVFLNMSKDPTKFLNDARNEIAKAEPDFKIAEKNYGKAIGYTKDTQGKIDIYFELSEMYIASDEWNKAAGCWKKITTYDSSNAKAMKALLDYTYEVATAGNWQSWKGIEADATEMINKEIDTSARMYRIKGQAILEQTKRGQKTNNSAAIKQAIKTLQTSLQMDPVNIDTYQYLADAIILKGSIMENNGILNSIENAKIEAEKILNDCINNNPDSPKSYINLYSARITEARSDTKAFDALEKDMVNLTKKFPDSPIVWSGISMLYQSKPKSIDKALDAAAKAHSLDGQNVNYALMTANFLYRKSGMNGSESDFNKAIEIANEALSYPDSIERPGPRARISFVNRFSLRTFLANCYLEHVSKNPADKEESLTKAQEQVHELIQLLGSAENPYAIMWTGRVALAQGKQQEGIKLLNAAYELMTASGNTKGDPQLGSLAYNLAETLKNTTEIGATLKFYNIAISNAYHFVKPDVLIDYATVMKRVRAWQRIIEIVNFYEEIFGTNSEIVGLKIDAYLASNMLDKAQEEIKTLSSQDPNKLTYEASLIQRKITNIARKNIGAKEEQIAITEKELKDLRSQQLQLMEKILSKPSKQNEAMVVSLCKNYISEKKLDKASKLVSNYLTEFPESPNVRIFEYILAEADPANVPQERLTEIALQLINNIKDPIDKNRSLAQYYMANGELDQAIITYEEILADEPNNIFVISTLFDIAYNQKDIDTMEKLAKMAKKYNADQLNGEIFKSSIDIANGNLDSAIARINSCIEERPIFSRGYLLRSQTYNQLQKYDDAIADAKKAYAINPVDGQITKNLASMLYARDLRLGTNISIEQAAETKQALEVAMASNPTDDNLKSFYAEYISDTSPDIAIAIGQQIQRAKPTVENALKLGSLATRIAVKTRNEKKKDAIYAIAEDSFKKAYEIDSQNKTTLNMYSDFLRQQGKFDEAQKLLAGNDELMWLLLLRNGQIDKAQTILNKLYQNNPKDANVVNGLLTIARNQRDNDNIIKYSDEFIELKDNTNAKLLQIEILLEAGLSQIAEPKLESFIEENPGESRSMFFKSWLLARQGKLKAALESTNNTLELNDKNARTWRLKGQINMGLGKFNEAIDDFRKSKVIQSTPETRIDLAKVYVRTKQYDEAVTELKIALEQQESNETRSMIEQVYSQAKNNIKLERFYKDTLKNFPQDIHWNNQYARYKLTQKDYDQALKLFETAYQLSIATNESNPDVQSFDGRFQALLLDKKYEQLISLATKDVEGPYSAIAYARMANAKFQLGDKDTSVQFFRRALEKAGANENYIIQILQQMNTVLGSEPAIKWCNEKLQTEPDSIAVNLSLFNIYKISSEYNKALPYIEKCIKFSNDNQQFNAIYRMNKANLLQLAYAKTSDSNYLKKAINEYESILEKQPMNLSVLNNIAYILAETKTNVEKALEYAQKAYNALQNNPNVLDTYGYVLLMNEDYKRADEILQVAVQLFETDSVSAPAEVYEHVGMAKEKLGQYADAITAYEQAIQGNLPEQKKLELKNTIERLAK